MSKLKVLKISQPTRPSIVSSNYSAKVKLSDLEGVDLTGLEDGRLLIYNANTGNFEAESADLNAFVDAYNKANAAFDQANTALAFTTTPSHVANSASAYANAAFIAANNGISLAQQAYDGSPTSNLINATQNTNIGYSWNHANSSFQHANASFLFANGTFSYSNTVNATQNTSIEAAFAKANNEAGVNATQNNSIAAAFAKANNEAGVNNTQNTNISYSSNHANSSFEQANASFHHTNAAFLIANSVAAYSNTVNNTQNTSIEAAFAIANSTSAYSNTVNNTQNTSIEAAFATANNEAGVNATQNNSIAAAFAAANNEAGVNNTQNTNITNAQNTADAAFNSANNINGVNLTQNTNITIAQNKADAAFNSANNIDGVNLTQNTNITNAQNTADAAFNRANNSLNANTGGTISGDINITGNLSVLGNTFTVSATQIVANDSMLVLGLGNYTSDVLDIGFTSHYNDGTNAHTGLIRDAGTKEYQLFEGYTGEVGANNNIDVNDPSFKISTLNANLHTQLVKLNNQDLQTLIDNAYSRANNSLNANTGGSISGNVIPTSDNTYYLGSETNRWHTLYVGPGSIDLGGLIIRNEGNVLTVSVGAGLPTPIAGSDEYARNHVNAAFNFANTTYIETTYAENHANAAFILANNINGIDLTQNNRITYASNHANASFSAANSAQSTATSGLNHAAAAFNYANGVFTLSNSAFNLANTNYLPSPNKHFISSGSGAGNGYTGGSQNPTFNPTFYATAGDTISFDLSGLATYSFTNPPYAGGFCIRYSANSSNLVSDASSGLTHISPTGAISTAAGAQGKISGQLFWKIPGTSFTIGSAANGVAQFVYQDALHTGGKVGSILVGPPTYLLRQFAGAAFNHANSAFAAANTGGADTFARNQANAAFIAANSSGSYANAAFLVANSAAAYSNTVNATQNTSITAAFAAANSASATATSAGIYANGAFAAANSAGGADTFARLRANSSYNGTALWAFGNYGGSQTTLSEAYGVIGNGVRAGQTSSGEEIIGSSTSQSSYAWEKLDQGLGVNFSDTTHAIKTDGTLWGWGRNEYGQIGDNSLGGLFGSTRGRSSPVQIGTNNDWLEVATENVCLAIRAYGDGQNQGTLWSWGQAHPTLGDNNGAAPARSSPVQIGSGTKWTRVAIGTEAAYALQQNGSLWGWGYNGFGQIGQNSTAILYYSQPVQISAGYPTNTNVFKQISVGYYCVGGVKTDGTLWTWGSDYGDSFGTSYFDRIGILGQNSIIDRSSPTQVGANTNWKMVSMGYSHAMGVKTDGTLWTWGENQHKNTFGGNPNVGRSSPAQIGSGISWKYVSAGKTHSAAITTEGYLRTCGNNNLSQAGSSQSWTTNHTTLKGLGADTVVPSVTGYLAKWKTVKASFNYTHAIKYQLDRDQTDD